MKNELVKQTTSLATQLVFFIIIKIQTSFSRI